MVRPTQRSGAYIVDGQKLWASPFLTVSVLKFKARAKLTFSPEATRKFRNLFNFSDEFKVKIRKD